MTLRPDEVVERPIEIGGYAVTFDCPHCGKKIAIQYRSAIHKIIKSKEEII